METLIERYKQMRKYNILDKQYKQGYAFVGIGNHALQNLYPVLNYLHIPLKYIVTRSEKSAKVAKNHFPNCETTTNLSKVLNDKSVKGVFICTTPTSHYKLVIKALNAGKHIFVEKPPCASLEELDTLAEIQRRQNAEVFVGLQRRYSPVFSILKSKLKNANHYIYRYVTGAFPEGNVLFELFIHPIDTIHHLFGKASLESCLHRKNTYLINVKHENGIIGSIELSTDYSWKESFEYLSVNTDNGVFVLNGLESLIFHKKPKNIADIPLEKIIPHTPQSKTLFNRNTFIPNIQNNDLFIYGFYDELKSFAEFCENGNRRLNKSGIDDVRNTFEFLHKVTEH